MGQRASVLAQRLFLPLLALGILNRLYLLVRFGSKRVGYDDAIIWGAALDYGSGIFREPYFYGQNYAVMLEALVAAPFTHAGIPLHILMPTVTSLLALLPFWSFAFWHRKHKRPLAALIFMAMPVLLPVEYAMMTMLTRSFVTGIAPLAFLPWLIDMRRERAQAFLIGLATSAAAFINPNSLVFSAAFLAWYVLYGEKRLARSAWLLTGTLPFLAAHMAAQAYCRAHPERMLHVVNDWRITFHPELVRESLGMLGDHFQWLFPLFPSLGALAFASLAGLAAWQLIRGNKACGTGLALALLLILTSFAFPKTHDGFNSIYYPYGRMFLAVPLLICWGLGAVDHTRWAKGWAAALLMVCALASSVLTPIRAKTVIHAGITDLVPVREITIAEARYEAGRTARIAAAYDVQLVTGYNAWDNRIPVEFYCYLFPVIAPSLPNTYFKGDRRYWRRDRWERQIARNLIIVGIPHATLQHWPASLGQLIDVSDSLSGSLHVLTGNTLPTDSLLVRMDQMRGMQ